MWSWIELPFDVLSKIFSFLSPDSLACASSTCKYWHKCTKTTPLSCSSNWFMALPMRTNTNSNNNNTYNNLSTFFTQNPINNKWHTISANFLPYPVKPLTSVQSLILFRATTNPTNLQLLVANPFTREFKKLPLLNTQRANSAVGVIPSPTGRFRVYVAGGSRGSEYDPAVEMYDSGRPGDRWRVLGSVPAEFAVRLTVWTPSDSVYSGGVLYWITSARAYSLIGWDISSNTWWTLRVPMAERLEFAGMVLRGGKVTVVGGTCGGEAHVWELLGERESWVLVSKVPFELGLRLVGEKESWVNTKCASSEGMVCLYASVGCGMIVWKEVGFEGKWDWFWVDGCRFLGGKRVPDLLLKGVFVRPKLSCSSLFLCE